ncbi:MAG: hypothetical protein P4L53_24655 [Candidatus Obscuribacterales bacterium]|nr:hypothetical protein [Candidatus Obscuribacterales bacterium]
MSQSLRTFVLSVFTIFLLTSCSSGNEIDCIKDPKSAVNKSFSIDTKRMILATTKSDGIFNLESKLQEDVKNGYKLSQKEFGNVGAAADVATHNDKYVGIVRSEVRRAQTTGQVTNINVNAQGVRTNEPLEVVVLAADHVKTPNPTLKVRVVNKRCAGSEVWILARDVYRFGHLIDFSHR